MAMITQYGVDKLTQPLRARFDLENQTRDRARRLRRAGRISFDPEDDQREQAVEMERLRQQTQDLTSAQQAVRNRYATDPTFNTGPTRLFDAPDLIDLPAAVLARGMGGGRMSPGELVRTEKDRVRAAGGSWGNEDDYNAGRALGSRPMMARAIATRARSDGGPGNGFDPTRDFYTQERLQGRDALNRRSESDQAARNQLLRNRTREALHVARRRGLVQFDPSLDPLDPRTPVVDLRPGPVGSAAGMIRPGDFSMRSGGVIRRGSATFEVSPGFGDRTAARPQPIFRPYGSLDELRGPPPSVSAAAISSRPDYPQTDPLTYDPLGADQVVDRRVSPGKSGAAASASRLRPLRRTFDMPDFAPSFR